MSSCKGLEQVSKTCYLTPNSLCLRIQNENIMDESWNHHFAGQSLSSIGEFMCSSSHNSSKSSNGHLLCYYHQLPCLASCKSSMTLCWRNKWDSKWREDWMNECEFWAGHCAGGHGGKMVWSLIVGLLSRFHGINFLFNHPGPADVASPESLFLDVLL